MFRKFPLASALVAATILSDGLLAASQAAPLILAQALSTPATPLIELLEEIPAPVQPTQAPAVKQPELASPAAKPQANAHSEALRPQSSTLSGEDPNRGQGRPAHLQAIQGMDSNVRITRVSDSESFGSHGYSKRQSWNLDETKLDIGGKILDATNNYQRIDSLNMSTEHHWSHTDANLIYGLKYNPTAIHFVKYDVSNSQETLINTFSGYDNCTIGDYEGSTSIDDRYVVLTCSDSSGNKDIISYDIVARSVLGTLRAESDFNWASVSQSGLYILVENNRPGADDQNRKLIRYDRNLQNPTLLITDAQHGDLGFDDNGDDVYVMIDWDYIFYVRIKDGARVNLGITNRAGNGHVSCRAFKRPGWCYFSSRDQNQRIFAAKIGAPANASPTADDRGRLVIPGISLVEMWGHSKATASRYENYAKASVSPSGRKIVFASDWWQQLNKNTPHPGGGGEAHEYVLELVP